MGRGRVVLLIAGLGLFFTGGCQSPESNHVPWYRGIPAKWTAANSLEAETWRRQRTGYSEGWPTPPQPVVSALGEADAGIAPPPPADEK